MKPHSLLREYGYVEAGARNSGEHRTMIYLLPDYVRDKIARVLKLSQKPDFALILNGRLEQWGRRVFNENESRYMLFHCENQDWIVAPRIIPYIDRDGKKQYRLKSRKNTWDTSERVLIKK